MHFGAGMEYLQNSDAKSSGVSGAEGGIPGGVYSPLGHTIPLLLVEVRKFWMGNRQVKSQAIPIPLIYCIISNERIKIPSSLFSDGIAIDPPAVFGVVIAVVVIDQGEFFVVHLAGPLDGLDESSGAGGCSIGGVIVSRRDRSLCVEDFRHILDEVMAVKVDSIILNQNQ